MVKTRTTVFTISVTVGLSFLYVAGDAMGATDLDEQVRKIFAENCVACHGPSGKRVLAVAPVGFDFVLDIERLSQTAKLIRPGDPQGSRLYNLIWANQMPFGAADSPDAQLTDEEKRIVSKWIAGLENQKQAERPFIGDDQIRKYIQADQGALGEGAGDARYLSFAHLYNAGDSLAQMDIYRQGLTKLLNSLTWSANPVIPVAVDPDRTVYRIRLSDLGWRNRDWKRLVNFNLNEVVVRKATQGVDKAFDLEDIYDEDASDYNGGQRVRTSLLGKGRKDSPESFLKADWFAVVASQPPMYYDLLRIPNTLGGLEKKLDVDRRSNIRNHKVARSAVGDSNVGLNNRLIERHEAKYGAYWISYDFAEDNEERSKDLFQAPLGPFGAGKYVFVEDGGEVIFNLPNGFQAYMLTTDEGFRLDTGPLNIVQDRSDLIDSTVINGISCIGCHSNGMNLTKDEIRPYVVESGLFPPDVVEEVKALYPPHEEMDALLQHDIDVFHEAQRNAGVDPSLRDAQNREPVTVLVKRFSRPLDEALAAAEFGLEEDAFMAELEKEGAFLDILTRLRQTNLPRERFILAYNKIELAMSDVQRPVVVASAEPQVPVASTGGDAPVANGDMAAALAAYKDGDWAAARDKFAALAETGDALAQHNLGTLYVFGKGVPQDYGRAVNWYRKAASQGFVDAQYALGLMYSDGYILLPEGDAAARRWFGKAAAQGHDEAAQKLASLGVAVTPAPVVRPEVVVASYEPPAPPSVVQKTEVVQETESAAVPRAAGSAAGWRVQLGALETVTATGPAWGDMKQRYADLLGELKLYVELAQLGHGTFYRVQAGPVESRADARALCSELARRGQDCLVVSQ